MDLLPDELHRRFGERLRELRQQAGLSQEQLAHVSGLSRNYVSELELGGKSPSLRTLARLAAGLHIELKQLLHP